MMLTTLATLSGCETSPSSSFKKVVVDFKDLQDFDQQDLSSAASSFYHSCEKLFKGSSFSQKSVTQDEWHSVCQKFLDLKPLESATFRSFLKNEFRVLRHEVEDGRTQGLLTGYFQPEIEASHLKTDLYKYPIYKRPSELIVIEDLGKFSSKAKGIRIAGTVKGGTLKPYYTRSEINAGALAEKGDEIAWAKDNIDLFFMHIQGSGRLLFEDGTSMHLSYDGTNGMAYTAIGRHLIEQGEISKEKMSMEAIKEWLRSHPNEAQLLLETNESYVFFKVLDRLSQGPIGAQRTPLTPFASLAVDPHYIALGSLVWLETDHPEIAQRLVVAQDVGGAIKGPLRGDFYCGSGVQAGDIAGPLKQKTSFYTLEPKPPFSPPYLKP